MIKWFYHQFCGHLINYFFGTTAPNIYTGFKVPDLEKLSEMVVFFTVQLQPWKTKMNKLLFYADFVKYSRTGFSMSGAPYRAIPMGPVPNNFNSLFEYLINRNVFDVHFTNFQGGGTGEQFKPNPEKDFSPEVFSDIELDILIYVAERFKNTSTNEIIEISHKETAWIENNAERKFIEYNYGFELTNDPVIMK